jgi:hypothetical protein
VPARRPKPPPTQLQLMQVAAELEFFEAKLAAPRRGEI